ncbi:MAG: MBL fold metallo-hydrolase [bacterium]|nr:MBL fold metallo-hydrolase [bacterium]
MQSTIHFYGGAGSVTGSNFLLEVNSPSAPFDSAQGKSLGTTKIRILVDCGLFQGKHSFEDKNWDPFPFDPKSISVLVNTHAHIDHIGRIPKLVKDGFAGKIISTEATRALAEPLLLDAMELSRLTAKRIGKEVLYDEHDIATAMRQWEGVPYHQPQDVGGGVVLELLDAGHILGSAMAKFTRPSTTLGVNGKSIVFTGDLGGGNSPLLPLVESPTGVQYLVMESVYGDRMRHDDKHRRDLLENIIEEAVAKGGTLLIPAFSTERTQDLLFEIRALMQEKRIPRVSVYLDSPLAEKITAAYLAYPQYFSDEMQKRIAAGEAIFDFSELRFVQDATASQKIGDTLDTKIIIAGSGMSNGGRVVAHESRILPDEKSTLLIVGYQAAGSLGRRLSEGAKSVEIRGTTVPVRCTVEAMYGYSAHMDGEQLLEFVNKVQNSLKEVFVVMGEPASAGFLVQRIRDYLGVKAVAPEQGEKAEIDF